MNLAFTEGKWHLLLPVILAAVLAWVYPLLGLIPLPLLLFILYFFRNPAREIMASDRRLLAPADGTVTRIKHINCDYVGPDAWEVSIFMSPLDVHVNRSPIQGVLEAVSHYPGKFVPAMNPDAPLINEKRIYKIQGNVKVKVVQIAGIMARRTVSWVADGSKLDQGAKIGMIKLGSCTQLVFPGQYNVLVQEGDKTQAGLTIIGEE